MLAQFFCDFVPRLQELGYDGSSEDGAFAYLKKGFEALSAQSKQKGIDEVLKYHILPDKLASAQITALTEVPTTLENVSFRRSNDAPLTLVDKAPALRDPELIADELDIEARNGVLHTIDRVAFPFAVTSDSFINAIVSLPKPEPDDEDDVAEDSDTQGPFSPTPKATTETGSSGSCFPASALVHLADGTERELRDLRAGDAVRATTTSPSNNAHSAVYFFSHKKLSGMFDFVRIETDKRHALTLSARHYVYVGGRRVVAEAVGLGDALETLDGPVKVTGVRRVKEEGLIAPHTMHGDLIVNRVRVSSYTATVHPVVAHFVLAPVRALVATGLGQEPLGGLLYEGAGFLADWAPRGPEVL